MARRFGLATLVVGLLFAGQGCSRGTLYPSVDSIHELPLGASREQVEARLGKRVASRPLPDGGSVDTYELHRERKNRQTATLTFDPDDRLVDYAPPPSYGVLDEALAGLALKEIRERCRSEHPKDRSDAALRAAGQRLPDYPYHRCVVWRLAIWGIE